MEAESFSGELSEGPGLSLVAQSGSRTETQRKSV